MDSAGTNELGKYRKYIQKRRVTPSADENADKADSKEESGGISHIDADSAIPGPDIPMANRDTGRVRRGKEEDVLGIVDLARSDYVPGPHYPQASLLPALRRNDTGLYKKLYSHSGRKAPAYQSPSPYKGYSSSSVEIQDNKATTLAVKIIKQALACFAILGIVIFMQSRPDMKDALAAVKKQVVETNIEPQSILDGIKNVYNQITTALGAGSRQKN